MSDKFKVGDKVRCKDNYGNHLLTVGNDYIVKGTNLDEYVTVVGDRGFETPCFTTRFDKVEEAPVDTRDHWAVIDDNFDVTYFDTQKDAEKFAKGTPESSIYKLVAKTVSELRYV